MSVTYDDIRAARQRVHEAYVEARRARKRADELNAEFRKLSKAFCSPQEEPEVVTLDRPPEEMYEGAACSLTGD